jgi:hypothetical protein
VATAMQVQSVPKCAVLCCYVGTSITRTDRDDYRANRMRGCRYVQCVLWFVYV